MENAYRGLFYRRRGDPEEDENDPNDKRIKLEPIEDQDPESDAEEQQPVEDVDENEATSSEGSDGVDNEDFPHAPLRLYDETQASNYPNYNYNDDSNVVEWVHIIASIECYMVNFGSFKVDLNSSSASQNEYESIKLAITNLSVQIDIVTQLKSIMINFPASSVVCLKVWESTSGPSSLFFELNDYETERLHGEFGQSDNFDSIEGGKFIKISTQYTLTESFLSKLEDIFIEKLQYIGETESDRILYGLHDNSQIEGNNSQLNLLNQDQQDNLKTSTSTATSPAKSQSSNSNFTTTTTMNVQNSLLALFSESVDVLARINCLLIKIGKYMVPVIDKEGFDDNFRGKIEIVITRQSVKIDINAPNMTDPSTQLKGLAIEIQFQLSSIVNLKVHHSGDGKNIFFFDLLEEESSRIREIFNLTPEDYSPDSFPDNIQAKFIKILIKDHFTPETISDLKEIFGSKLEFMSKYESSVLDGFIPNSSPSPSSSPETKTKTETSLVQASDTTQNNSKSLSESESASISMPPPSTSTVSTGKKISIHIEEITKEVLKINCYQFNVGKYHAATWPKECLDKISLIMTSSGNIRIHFISSENSEMEEDNKNKTIIGFPIASVVSLKVRVWKSSKIDVFFFELNLEECLKIKNQLKIDEKDYSHFAPDANIRARYLKLWLNHLTDTDYEKLEDLFKAKLKFIDVAESDFLNGTAYKARIKKRLPPPAPIFSQQKEETEEPAADIQSNSSNKIKTLPTLKKKMNSKAPQAPIPSKKRESETAKESQCDSGLMSNSRSSSSVSKNSIYMSNCFMVKIGQYRVTQRLKYIDKIELKLSSQRIIIDINTPDFYDRVTKRVGKCFKIVLPTSSILSVKMYKSVDSKNILFLELNQEECSKLRRKFNLPLNAFSPDSAHDHVFIKSKYLKVLTKDSLTDIETQKMTTLFGNKFKFVDSIEAQILDGTRPRPKSKIVKISPTNDKYTWKRKADVLTDETTTVDLDKNSKKIRIVPSSKMSKPSTIKSKSTLDGPISPISTASEDMSDNSLFSSTKKNSQSQSPLHSQLQSTSKSPNSVSPAKSTDSTKSPPSPITVKCKQIYFGLYLFEGDIEIVLLPGIKSLNILLKSEEGAKFKSTHRLPGDPNIKYFYSTKVSHDDESNMSKKNLTFCIDGNLTEFVTRILKSLSNGKLIAQHFYNRQSTDSLSMKYISMIVEESEHFDLNLIEQDIIQTFGDKCQNLDCILVERLSQDLLDIQPNQSFSPDSKSNNPTSSILICTEASVHLSCKWVKAGDYMVCAKSKNDEGYIDVRISDKMVLIDINTPQYRDRVTNMLGRECSFGFPVSSVVQVKFSSIQGFSSFFLLLTPEECEKIRKCLEFDRSSLKFPPRFDPTLPETDGNRYFKFETIPYKLSCDEVRDLRRLQKLFELKFEVIDGNTAYELNGRAPKLPKTPKPPRVYKTKTSLRRKFFR